MRSKKKPDFAIILNSPATLIGLWWQSLCGAIAFSISAKGSTINDLGGAEKISDANFFFLAQVFFNFFSSGTPF